MMKPLLGLLIFFMGSAIQAQETTEEQELRKIIETFFQGFHDQDSLTIKSVTANSVIMQSIGATQEGVPKLHKQDFGEFLNSIVSIPSETTFKEELHSFTINIDGAMANVWTPYSLYIDGNLSHCGVNNFQLFKDQGKWKIIYLIDTRTREGCEE